MVGLQIGSCLHSDQLGRLFSPGFEESTLMCISTVWGNGPTAETRTMQLTPIYTP